MYQIINTHTKQVVGTRATRKMAQRRADVLDLEYGAVRYIVKCNDAKATIRKNIFG